MLKNKLNAMHYLTYPIHAFYKWEHAVLFPNFKTFICFYKNTEIIDIYYFYNKKHGISIIKSMVKISQLVNVT